MLARDGELDQTDLFEIVVQAVGLGVHRNPLDLGHAPDQLFQRGTLSDINVLGFRCIQRFHLLLISAQWVGVAIPMTQTSIEISSQVEMEGAAKF